jgi:sodium transport system ATP-binding protein
MKRPSQRRSDALIHALGMSDVADRQPKASRKASAPRPRSRARLVHDPKNVILDEPTNGLDVMTTRALRGFLQQLRAEGRCVVFSSHIMQEVAALCDRIVIIAKGRVVAQGTPEQLRAQTGEANLEDAFVKAIGSEEGLFA